MFLFFLRVYVCIYKKKKKKKREGKLLSQDNSWTIHLCNQFLNGFLNVPSSDYPLYEFLHLILTDERYIFLRIIHSGRVSFHYFHRRRNSSRNRTRESFWAAFREKIHLYPSHKRNQGLSFVKHLFCVDKARLRECTRTQWIGRGERASY